MPTSNALHKGVLNPTTYVPEIYHHLDLANLGFAYSFWTGWHIPVNDRVWQRRRRSCRRKAVRYQTASKLIRIPEKKLNKCLCPRIKHQEEHINRVALFLLYKRAHPWPWSFETCFLNDDQRRPDTEHDISCCRHCNLLRLADACTLSYSDWK